MFPLSLSSGTYGTISGSIVDGGSSISATIGTAVTGSIEGAIGTPGPQGPAGSQGAQGVPGTPGAPGVGVPTGGTAGQFLTKTTTGVDYATGWTTFSGATESWVTANFYPLTGNPSGFLQAAALAPYLTSATASATYQTLSGMSAYLPKAGGVITGDIQSNNGSQYRTYDGAYSQVNMSAAQIQLLNSGVGGGTLSIEYNGITFASGKQTVHYPGTSILSGYATESWVTAGFAPIAAGMPTSGTVGQVLTKNSGTSYDASWQTLIPGDRYLTSSTTSLTINNANKTLTVGTGLSYTSQQDVIIAYDAAHHMHARVTAYNSSTGQLDVDVISHTGTGTFASWTVNVGGTVPVASIVWGDITGTLGNQTDLATALNAKLEITDAASTYYLQTNPSGFITSAALSGYATQSWVTAGFYPLSGNPSGFITSSALSGYATESWVTSQGYLTSSALTGYATESFVTSQGYLTDAPSDGNQYARKNGAWDVVSAGSSYITSVSAPLSVTSGDLSIDLTTYETIANAAATYYPLTNPSAFIDASALSPYLTSATAASTYQTLSGMSSYLTTSAAATTYAPKASPALTGNVTITTNSTSPALVLVQDGTGDIIQFKDVTSDTTYSFIDQTGKVGTIASTTTNAGFNIPHGAPPTTPVNGDIWTTTAGLFARISGSSRQYVDFDGTQTINGNKTFSNANNTFGNSTATGTTNLASGATISGSTKTVNIGTSGVAGSTTNIAIGSTTGTSTTTLQGITNGVTQSAGDSSLKLATTAFVTTADNLKANLASPTFTGTPLSTTAAVDTNTTQIATTAYVVGQGYLKSATAASTYAPLASPTFTGTVTIPAGASISGFAPMASPALSGTPTAPTATAGTNTTQIATTAFVLANAGSTSFATNAEVATGTSTTTALYPGHAGFLKADPRLRQLGAANYTSVTGSGAITAGSGQQFAREMYLGSLAAGRAVYGYGILNTEAGMVTSKANKNQINFSKKIWVAGSCSAGITASGTNYYGDANTNVRVSFGGYSGYTSGNMSQKGIGWKKVGGTTTFVNLTVHNGTTLTDVATTFAPVANEAFDWVIYSDGSGNVTLYINGSQAATTTAGPTGTTTSNYNAYIEQVDATATPTVRHAMHANGGWIYLAD